MAKETEKPIFEQICDASSAVLAAANILVTEYTQGEGCLGTQKAMIDAEEKLIETVKSWRKITGG